MKKTVTFVFINLLVLNLYSQGIVGKWGGLLVFGGQQLRIVFNIEQEDIGYSATMDSPDQSTYGIKATSVEYSHSEELVIVIKPLKIKYTGKITSDTTISGTFTQSGIKIPLDLSKNDLLNGGSYPTQLVRKQDPKQPFPYSSEDVEFINYVDEITLAGTITTPNKPGRYPAVVLVSGSGAQDRNEEVFGHRPFLVISDYLTKKGIIVLRFDDRGVGTSTGIHEGATTLDFANDAMAAINFLKIHPLVDTNKIGIIGHSEGGMIAPIVANKSSSVSFIVLLAAPGVPCDELMVKQMTDIYSQEGRMQETDLSNYITLSKKIFELIKSESDSVVLEQKLTVLIKESIHLIGNEFKELGLTEDEYTTVQIESLTSPWMRYFLRYKPEKELSALKCSVLALNGTHDLQVSSKENLSGIKSSLLKGDNKDFKIIEYPKLNHLFQRSKTGHPQEYASIKQTFSPKVMKDIAKWINSL